MILSRTLAKRRIAAGVRPGWAAAWAPVAFDAACLLAVFAMLFGLFQALSQAVDLPMWATIAALFFLGFIPTQVVLILSSFWASRSRFREEDAAP